MVFETFTIGITLTTDFANIDLGPIVDPLDMNFQEAGSNETLNE